MVTALFAIAGWAFTHYQSASDMQLVVASLALLVVALIVLGIRRLRKTSERSRQWRFRFKARRTERGMVIPCE